MAVVLTDVQVTLDGNDITAEVMSATLDITVDEVGTTTMGDGGYKSRAGGLKDGQLSLELRQGYAAAGIDSILFPLLGTTVAFLLTPTSAAVSANNPSYAGNVTILSYQPISNGVGELAKVTLNNPVSGVVTRATS